MPSNLNLDYYYGTEADQYSFYRIPKTLLTDPRYKSVSIEAKVLYGLLLDRMGLSVKNGWMDSDKRVYIYFTQEDAMTLMSCGKDKATKLFRELDKGGEDFWAKAEALYYQALIAYIWYEAPEEEKNMTTLLEMLNASEVREDDENFKNAVDLMFEQLESRDPDHFAVRQYKKYKMAAGDLCSKRLVNSLIFR